MQLFVHSYHHHHQQWTVGAIHQNTFSILHHSQWPTKQKGAKPNKKSNRSSASQQLSLSVLDTARLIPDYVHLWGRLGRKERQGKILREEWNIFWLLIVSSLWEFRIHECIEIVYDCTRMSTIAVYKKFTHVLRLWRR